MERDSASGSLDSELSESQTSSSSPIDEEVTHHAVILHSKSQQRASTEHSKILKADGKSPRLILCDDAAWFEDCDLESVDSLHILVDPSLFNMLMNRDYLHDSVRDKLIQFDDSHKQIFIIDKISAAFERLRNQIPPNAKWWPSDYTQHPSSSGLSNKPEVVGMTGGGASNSTVTGTLEGQQVIVYGTCLNFSTEKTFQVTSREIKTANHGSSLVLGQAMDTEKKHNTLKIILEHGKKENGDDLITKMEINKDKLRNSHVEEVFIEKGSVIVTLKVERSHIMTDEWIHTVLKTIFHDILAEFLCSGWVFTVRVERHITIPQEEILKLYTTEKHSDTHENCVSKEKYELLEAEISKLSQMTSKKEGNSEQEDKKDESKSEGDKTDADSNEDEKNEESINEEIKEGSSDERYINKYLQDWTWTPTFKATEFITYCISDAKQNEDWFYDIQKPIEELNRRMVDNRSGLYTAAKAGFSSFIKEILKSNPDVNGFSDDDTTPLHAAAEGGHTECIEILLEAGANVNLKSADGQTALFNAATSFNGKCVELLLKAGADVNLKSADGQTALFKAAQAGNDKCVELLLKAGADVNLKAADGQTALFKAAIAGNDNCVELLLKARANVSLKAADGQTALFKAAIAGNDNCVELLLKARANVNLKAADGQTALFKSAIAGNDNCVELLLMAGADVNLKAPDGQTALFNAATSFNGKCVELLLEAGADVNLKAPDGQTALFKASNAGNDKCVELLLKAGAGVDFQDSFGNTAFHEAEKQKHEKCVKRLVDAGADVNLHKKYGD